MSEPQQTAADGWSGLRTQLAEDLERHKGDWRCAGFQAVATHRFGTWMQAHARRPWRRLAHFVYDRAERRNRLRHGIELPIHVQLGRRVRIIHQHGIVIHGQTIIGDDVVIRHGVTLGGGAGFRKGRTAPTIGDRVDLSPGCQVIGPVRIGDDVSIGPNCVVTRNVKAGSTVMDPPPRILDLGAASTE